MNFFIKNFKKSALILLAVATGFASCQKDNNAAAPLSANGTQAVVNNPVTITVNGNYGNPALGPTAFGTRYVNIVTGAQDSVGTVAYNLLFTGTNNGTIGPKTTAPATTFKYLISTKALTAVTTADYTSATTSASFGRNTSTDANNPNGWWNYNATTHVASPVSNIILFVRVGTTNYAFKPTGIVGQGGALSNRAVYTFSVGQIQ